VLALLQRARLLVVLVAEPAPHPNQH